MVRKKIEDMENTNITSDIDIKYCQTRYGKYKYYFRH